MIMQIYEKELEYQKENQYYLPNFALEKDEKDMCHFL